MEQASITRFPSQFGGAVERVEQLYWNKNSIYDIMFNNVYYGVIGKQCFATQWRCISYMEIAPLAPRLYFDIQPTPRS